MRKKILYIQHGGNSAGAARSLGFLIEGIDKTKFEPYVLCISDKKNISFYEKLGAKVYFNDKIEPIHGSTVSTKNFQMTCRNIIFAIPSYLRFKKYINDICPDILHLNSSCLAMASIACKNSLKKIPVITHIREPLRNDFWGNLLRKIHSKYTDMYIAIDNYDLKSMNPKNKKAVVVYNFVDFNIYNSNHKSDVIREELGIKKNSPIFLYLARIAQSNGAIELAKEFSKEKYNNYNLVFVGDNKLDKSKYANELRTLVNKSANMFLLDFRNDVTNLIASSDVIVCPFVKPHFSRTIIEAAAMGKPSIATDIDGPRELIINGKTGFLFNPTNFSTIYKYIVELGENKKLCKEMGIKSEKFARKNFNSKDNIKVIEEVYTEILSK